MACLFLCRVFGGRGRCGSGPSVISGCWRHTRTPNHTTPWCTSKPYHTIPYLTILYNTILWCHGVPLHPTIPYHTIKSQPYNTMLNRTLPYLILSYQTGNRREMYLGVTQELHSGGFHNESAGGEASRLFAKKKM